MPCHFCRVQIAWAFLRGKSFGVTTSAARTKHPSQRNRRNCKLLLPTASISTDVDKHLFSTVLSSMKNDTIFSMARHDQVILPIPSYNPRKGGQEECKLCVTEDAPARKASLSTTHEKSWEGGSLRRLHRHFSVSCFS